MKLARAAIAMRLLCLVLSALSFAMAWRLQRLGASGAEDVPPPFIVVAGLMGFASLLVAGLGWYPRFR
jgi:hypothetical protein